MDINGYYICGPPKSWLDELRIFADYPVKYFLFQGCVECKTLRPTRPFCSRKEEATSHFLDIGRPNKHPRMTDSPCPPPCPWISYFPAPSLGTISDESAKFPFLISVKPGLEACFLKNLVLPLQVELKHQRISPSCRNYAIASFQVRRAPHCCFYVSCFYSRKSWMLLYQRYPACCEKNSVLVLLNPLTNEKIDLPAIHSLYINDAAFSVSATDANASPDCVIAVVSKLSNGSLMYVAMWRPGRETWEIHPSEDPNLSVDSFLDMEMRSPEDEIWGYNPAEDPKLSVDTYLGMVFCGKRVHCFTIGGWMHVFDLDGDRPSWGQLRKVHDPNEDVERCRRYGASRRILVTVAGERGSFHFCLGRDDGEILKILSWQDKAGKRRVYHFYRLDQLELKWIKVDENEWIGRSWFFSDQYVFSTTMIGGGKMFRKSHARTERERVKLIYDDLHAMSSHHLAGDFLHGSSWVSLGC